MRHGQRPPADTSRDSGAVEEEEEEQQPRASSPPPPPPTALSTGHRLGIQNPPAGPTSVCVCVYLALDGFVQSLPRRHRVVHVVKV